MAAPAPEDLAPSEPAAVSFTIALLGPMQVLVQGRLLPRLRSRKALWLLALLTLRHGRPVEREWLAATLWPDAAPARSLSNLRSVLLDLRTALGSEAVRLLAPSRSVLSLELRGADVDVIEFDEAAAAQSLPALARAVSLYRGPLLEDCDEEWVGQERTSREQDCLRALLVLAEAARAGKDWTAAAEYSRRAVALDLWRDGARRSLMMSLAGGGDLNAALLAYREFVTLLRDDPRAAPDGETSALYARLRTQARQAGRRRAVRAVTESPTDAEPIVSGYLPHPLTDLVGREGEQKEVAALLRRSRLVTLTGPGGIGKTRLAVAVAAEVAGEYPGGVWLVAMEALIEGRTVAPQIAAVLGIKEKLGQSPLEALVSHLREKRLLLVLDNCEHLLEAAAHVVGQLLRECVGVRVLATSREPLAIMGETAWAVPGLTVSDPAHLPAGGPTLLRALAGYEGVQLFVERAQAVQKTFALTQDTALAVAQVCSRLEGIPLALELAAARVRSMTVVQMVARLNDHLGLLTDGSRVAPSRQRTLRATLDWSYTLLSVPEQLLLARVSVFAGGWSLEAVETVCAGDGIEPGHVLDLLTGLVDKSLATFDTQPQEGLAEGSGRYRLLETVRQYAAERLGVSGPAARVRVRHRDWFLALAEEAHPHLRGPAQTVWLSRLNVEQDNLRTALDLCETETQGAERESTEMQGTRMEAETEAGLRLAGALWWFWRMRGRYAEGRKRLEQALARAPGRTLVRANALNSAGALAHTQGDDGAARPLHEEGMAIYRELGNTRGVAISLNHLGNVANRLSDHRVARALWEESLALYRTMDDPHGTAIVLGNLAGVTRQQGDYAAAQALQAEALPIYRRLGDRQGVAVTLANLGNMARLRGDYAEARVFLAESLSLFREVGDRANLAFTLSYLGAAATALEDYASARALFEESLGIRRELGEKSSVAWSLSNLGLNALYEDRLQSARGHLEESLGLFRELGDRLGAAWALNNLSDAVFRSGEKQAARALLAESLSVFWEVGDKEGVAESLRDTAAMCEAEGAGEWGARLWGAAEALRESIGAPLSPVEQRKYDRQVAHARALLGENAFAAAWAEGRALTWEQAAAYALEANRAGVVL